MKKITQTFTDLYNGLNDAQQKAVDKIDGPVMVVAGPGTGKTQILAARIGNILLQTDTAPQNILCLTYTDVGAYAMRQRLKEFIGTDAQKVNIYTFHAFCNNIITSNSEYFNRRDLVHITELEEFQIIEEIFHELSEDNFLRRVYKSLDVYIIKRILTHFNKIKEENWSEKEIIEKIKEEIHFLENDEGSLATSGKSKGKIKVKVLNQIKQLNELIYIVELYEPYCLKMKSKGFYTYNDMVLWVISAFKTNPNLLANYQESLHYFLIDEFQDTNGAQNEVIQLLTSFWGEPNVFVVGDDDQSIYRFQGANVKNIFDFYKKYEKSIEVIILDKNYRSRQSILDSSMNLIGQNKERLINNLSNLNLSKELVSSNPIYKDETQNAVFITEYENYLSEQVGIFNQINKLLSTGVNPNEIAIIYRNNAQAKDLIKAFSANKINISIKKKEDILKSLNIKFLLTILEYLSTETNSPFKNSHLFIKILIHPWFGLSHLKISEFIHLTKSIKDIPIRKYIHENKAEINEEILSVFELTEKWLNEYEKVPTQALLEEIIDDSNLITYALKQDNKFDILSELRTFFDIIKKYTQVNPEATFKDILKYVKDIEEYNLTINRKDLVYKQNGIKFLTAHGSKGLEFEHVFVISCQKDKWNKKSKQSLKFPSSLMNQEDQEENEEESRRLMYVALTRAKKAAYLSYHNVNLMGKMSTRSIFIDELLENESLELIRQEIEDQEVVKFVEENIKPQGEPTVLDKEYIDKILEKMTLSVTSMNNYIKCPVSFYYNFILKIPRAKTTYTAFGIAMHAAVEEYDKLFKEEENIKIKKAIDQYIYIMYRNKEVFTDSELKTQIAFGKNALEKYFQSNPYKYNKILGLETEFNTMIDNIKITGKVDKIIQSENGLMLIDYKTGTAKSARMMLPAPFNKRTQNEYGGEYFRQAVFYKLLFDLDNTHFLSTHPMREVEFCYIHDRDNDGNIITKKIEISLEHTEWMKTKVKETDMKIKNHEFSQGCNEESCEWCNLNNQLA